MHLKGVINGHVNGSSEHMYSITEHPLGEARHLRIVSIGAGAAGLNLAHHMGRHMRGVELCIYEKNSGVGGMWRENRYPGVGCDIPSHDYQYTWAPNPDRKEFYSSGAEILGYLEIVATKYKLERFVRFELQVLDARWLEADGKWKLKIRDLTSNFEFADECDFFINAGGYLNNWVWPDIAGLQSFEGTLVHSAAWPEDLDLAGKTVAVLGNGISGIQVVPALQPFVQELVTFIRNPTWVTAGFAQKYSGPSETNFTFSNDQKKQFRDDPEAYLAYRKGFERELVTRFPLLHKDSPQQAAAVKFSREEMKRRLGEDNPLLNHLIPDFVVGCRRPTPGVGYLEALTEPNRGELIKVDASVCATGFDVSFHLRFPIVGRNGVDLAQQWKDRPTGYLALAAANMPNYFMFQGPNSPVGHGSAMLVTPQSTVAPSTADQKLFNSRQIIEHSTKYMLNMIHKAQTEGYKAFAPKVEAIDDFVEHADEFLKRTVWAGRCKCWFKNGTVDGPVTALHPGSRIQWFHMLTKPRYEDWEWTTDRKNRFSYLGNGYSVLETGARDFIWYLNDPDQGSEGIVS